MSDIVKKKIEIDVDGVLANMDGSYAEYVKDIIPDFSEEKYITEWNMPFVEQNYPEAFKRISSLWDNPTFIRDLPRYPKIEDGMIKLYNSVKGVADIIVHTHIFNPGAVFESRNSWLEDLREDTNVDFMIDICTGSCKKTRTDSYIVIEDNVRNLRNSNADYKILIRRGHNRNYSEKDLGSCKKSFVCNSFYDSVDIVKNILRCK
jgi:5'(3')-deoxyribonucleotidase